MKLTETRTYLLWENAGQKLFEAQLTPDQIQNIFQSVEKGLSNVGGNRTLAGKGKDAASAVNKAWEDLKTKVQNSGPIKDIDAKYDAAAEKLKQATGGDQGVMKYIQKYRDFAKKHPVAQGLIYSALIAAAGISGAGVGGAAALGLLKMTDKLLQGEKFSSAAYAGAKTGGIAYAAGQIGQHFKNQQGSAGDQGVGGDQGSVSGHRGASSGDMNPGDYDKMSQVPRNPDGTLMTPDQINAAKAALRAGNATDMSDSAGVVTDSTGPDQAWGTSNIPDTSDAGSANNMAGGTSNIPDTVTPNSTGQSQEYVVKKGDTLSQIAKDNNISVKELQAANPDITNVHKIATGQKINIPAETGSPVYDQGVGLGRPAGSAGASYPQSQNYNTSDAYNGKSAAAQLGNTQPPKGAAMSPEYLQQVISGEQSRPMISAEDAKKALDWQTQNGGQIASTTSNVSSGAGKGFDPQYLRDIIDGKISRPFVSPEKAKELLDKMKPTVKEGYVYLTPGVKLNKHQIEKVFIFTSMVSPVINEGVWDTVKGAAGKAANWVKTKGHNITTKVTADKLNSAWEKGGKPTDSNQLFDLLVRYPVDKDILTSVFKDLGIDVAAQTQNDQGSQDNDDDTQASTAGRTAFSQMSAQLSGSNKTPGSKGGTITKTPTGQVHTKGQGAGNDLAQSVNTIVGNTGEQGDDTLQSVQTAWAKAKNPAQQTAKPAQQTAKPAQQTAKPAQQTAKPAQQVQTTPQATPRPVPTATGQGKQVFPSFGTAGQQAGIQQQYKQGASQQQPVQPAQPVTNTVQPSWADPKSKDYVGRREVARRQAAAQQQGTAQTPANQQASNEKSAIKKRTGGKKAGELSQTPNAIRKREARAKSAQKTTDTGSIAENLLQMMDNLDRKYSLKPRVLETNNTFTAVKSIKQPVKTINESTVDKKSAIKGDNIMKNVDKDVAAMLQSLKKYDMLAESVAPVLAPKKVDEHFYYDSKDSSSKPQDILGRRQPGAIAKDPESYRYMRRGQFVEPPEEQERIGNMYKLGGPKGRLPEGEVDETLGKSATAGEFIHDFVHSDDPKFSGDSKAERIKRALGAYYGEHPEKSRKEESVEEKYMGEGMCKHCECDPCECGPDQEIMEWMKRFSKLGRI